MEHTWIHDDLNSTAEDMCNRESESIFLGTTLHSPCYSLCYECCTCPHGDCPDRAGHDAAGSRFQLLKKMADGVDALLYRGKCVAGKHEVVSVKSVLDTHTYESTKQMWLCRVAMSFLSSNQASHSVIER